MTLSCSCGEWDGDGVGWYEPKYFIEMPFFERRKRCASCGELIATGSLVLKFERARGPLNDIEEDIYGDEVWLSPQFQCECCGDIFFNLIELGYCVQFDEDMHELLKEYVAWHQVHVLK